jgi:hypothetical protein
MIRQIIEEVRKDEVLDAIFTRIEKEHGSRVKRIARQCNLEEEKCFFMTLILENYELLEVELKAEKMLGIVGLEVEIQVF